MSFSLSSSCPSPNPSSPCSTLLRLPAVLLPHVCSFLSPRALLVSLTQTAKATRDVLTPACFSSHVLALGSRELALLCSLIYSSHPLCQSSFHCRVLSDCRLSVHCKPHRSTTQRQLYDSLRHFPACKSLTLHGTRRHPWPLTDSELYTVLRHPTTVSCSEFELEDFTRVEPEPGTDYDDEWGLDRLGNSYKRRRSDELSRQRQLGWAAIRLPAVTRLRLDIFGSTVYTGGAAFITAHTALVELAVTTLLVSVSELTQLFQDSAVLPQLTRFGLQGRRFVLQGPAGRSQAEKVTLLVTALATTAVGVSGRPRQIEGLSLDIPNSREVFAAAALMPGLTSLDVGQATEGWLEEWTGTQAMLDAFPLLQECYVRVRHPKDSMGAARDVLPFLQSMASRPLQRLNIQTGEPVTFDALAIAQLARHHQLNELCISIDISSSTAWMDWRDAALFTSLTPNHFPHLRIVMLDNVRMSEESVVAIVSAAPQLRVFDLSYVEPSCHPAVVCAIVGGYCEWIETMEIEDQSSHAWRDVQAADIVDSYQSAATNAGRSGVYKPFTQFRHLYAVMCWCTPAAVWHALLSLLRWATRLHCINRLASNDPLVVSALAPLPSITTLSGECLWPKSFIRLVRQRVEQSGSYRFLGSQRVSVDSTDRCPGQATLELSDAVEKGDEGLLPVLLRSHSDLLAAYQRSLSAEQQTVLARWARGDFQAGDERLMAAECAMARDEEKNGHGKLCPHPHLSWRLYETAENESSEEEGSGCDEDGDSEWDDEQKDTEGVSGGTAGPTLC